MEKFTYTIKDKPINIHSDNFLANYLRSLGIKKVKSFIDKPSHIDEEPAILLDNIDMLTEELHKGFTKGKKFFLQVDSDADGYTSAAIFYNYFKERFPEAQIEYRIHAEKEHGIIVNTVPEDTDIVIIPDAGTNQYEEQMELAQKGMLTLIMDHHHADDFQEIENTIVVNNQLSKKFRNKDLSGAGVVFKCIQYYSKLYSDGEDYKKFTDLAAMGIVSDMMDTRNLDNNFIIYHGFRNIRNKLFEAMLYQQEYSITSVENPNKIDIAFYIAPLINGVIRAGTEEEKLLLFKGFVEQDRGREIYERDYNGRTIRENFYEMVARTAVNIKEKQNRTKEKALEFLSQKIDGTDYMNHSILVAITSRDDEITIPKTMTGLTAMEFVKKYGKPTLVVRPKRINKENYLFGSGRAPTADGFESFRDTLNKSSYTYFAQGHDNAFGFGVKEDDLPHLINDMDELLKDIDFETDKIEVDYIFNNQDIHASMLNEFAKAMPLYGNGIAQPKFAFKVLLSTDHFSVMGSEKNVVKFNYKNIDFIKFRDPDLANFITRYKGLYEVEFIGRSQINEYRGRKTLQIIVDYLKMNPVKGSSLI